MTTARDTRTTCPKPARRHSGEEIVDIVGKTVGSIHSSLPWGVEEDELTQIGALAYLELEASFDPEHEVPFQAYLLPRLRGRIIDHAWRLAGWSRSHFRTARRIADQDAAGRNSVFDASSTMAHINGQVQDSALSVEHLSSEDYENEAALLPISRQPGNPERVTVMRRQRQALRGALRRLPSDDAHVIRAIYVEERPCSAIGPMHGKSASWVCRTHKRLLGSLHEEMTESPTYVEEPSPLLDENRRFRFRCAEMPLSLDQSNREHAHVEETSPLLSEDSRERVS